jgi:tetratricopeptide (TPR) repeat protein
VFYYGKQLTAAKDARDSVSIHHLALEASARFPKNTNFLLILGREALDHGLATEALGFVERALAIEPTNSVALQLAITAYAKTGAADSAFATARRALAANVPSDAVGASLLAVVSPALSAAQTSQARADWETALRLAQAVDTVASTPRSAFYVGVSAFQIAIAPPQRAKGNSQRAKGPIGCVSGIIRRFPGGSDIQKARPGSTSSFGFAGSVVLDTTTEGVSLISTS